MMPRYGRYLRLEKNIAASDTGGILERWRFGRRLLMDDSMMSASRQSLKPGVAARLVAEAKAQGYKTLSESEIRYRLQAARTYETEAQIAKILGDLENWWGLIQARFPQVEMTADGTPYDPRDADEKDRDFRAAVRRMQVRNPGQPGLPEVEAFIEKWNPPYQFRGDEHGPRSPLTVLYAVQDEGEQMTANFVKHDRERRDYLDECASAVGGDLTKTWGEAEMRRQGLAAIGVSSLDSAVEILNDFFRVMDFPEEPHGDRE